jgi:hypothetical protein
MLSRMILGLAAALLAGQATPPLDSFRRDSVGVTITDVVGAPPVATPTAPIPSLSDAALAALAMSLAMVAAATLRRRASAYR